MSENQQTDIITIKMQREKKHIYDYDSDCYSGNVYEYESDDC